MSEPIVTFDEETMRDELKKLVRKLSRTRSTPLSKRKQMTLSGPRATREQQIVMRTALVTMSEGPRPHLAK